MSLPVFDGDRWKALEPLLDQALSLSPEARAAWLDALRADAPELAGEVSSLLAHQEAADRRQFLAEPLMPRLEGLQIGAYMLERPLGEGGMGTVWLARRTDGRFDGCAAVKLLNRGLLSAAGQERFRREGSILARLAYPGIARLFDAGVSPQGQPYLVLEYVEGQRIDAFADERRLTTTERIELVLQVLDAVDHAHKNLIVHRDLKPSNILVTSAGAAKLLDFGIAKLLAPDGAEEIDALTRDGRALTPAFAAPEQLRGAGVTTATDVYAVGVLLYLLLTGRHPYDLSSRSASELERIVCDETPPRPSAMFDAPAADGDLESESDRVARARARGATPSRLRRQLRGDLDVIVMKALRKEPERRYQTAAALQDDLRRALGGHPVLARPDTVGYRVGKFLGRHRGGVAAAAVLLMVLGAGVVRERTLRARAEAEAHKARAVESYLVSVFDVADPFAPSPDGGPDVTARALLDRGAARIGASLAAQPEVQAELRGVLGRVYSSLGLFDKAEPLLRRALDQQRALHGDRHVDVATAMDRLGETWLRQSRFDQAEPLLREAVAQRRALLGTANADTARSLDNLATLLQERSEFAAAEPLFREAIEVRRAVHGPEHEAVALSLNNLGVLLFMMGRDEEAAPLYRECLSIYLRRLGESHPLTLQTFHNLAQILGQSGQLEEAEAIYRRTLAAKRKTLGNAHPAVTVNLNNLAILLTDLGKVDEAQQMVQEALALDRQMFGAQHAYVAESLRNLGTVRRLLGDFTDAEKHYREALAMNRALFGEQHIRIASNLGSIGSIRHLVGDLDGAVEYQRQALAQFKELVGVNHSSYATVSNNLARALRDRGEPIEAARLYRAASTRLDPARPRQRVAFIIAQIGLGRSLVDLGRPAEAMPLLERAVAMSRERFGARHWRTGEAELALGICLAASAQYARAEPLLRDAEQHLQTQRLAQPPLLKQAGLALARVHADWPGLRRDSDLQ